MKKLLAFGMALLMALALVACSSGDGGGSTPAAPSGNTTVVSNPEGPYRIAIVKQMEHISLDEIATAIEDELMALGTAQNIEITVEVFSGQGDATTLNQIGSQIVSDEFDAIIPIATLAAQCMVNAADGTDIPVIYAAVSDPEAAELTGITNVTGVSDALDTEKILDMMFTREMLPRDPEITKVGLLYSLSEPNSKGSIEQAKQYLDALGVEYVEATGSNADEIATATVSIMNNVDAVFTPTDNIVMANAALITSVYAGNGIPYYAGADSFVTSGAFATCGVNYTELGKYAAGMALDVIQTGSVPEYYTMPGGIITVNTETAAMLEADYSVFEQYGTIVEVETIAE